MNTMIGPAPSPSPAAAAGAVSSSYYASPAASSVRRRSISVRGVPDSGRSGSGGDGAGKGKLKVGSPIVIVEAPLMLKTAASVPSLRHNAGQVKAGDVGRVMARKPKDVWAVRLAIGTYLLDGKYFKALDVDDEADAS
ncbi:hypothetical protein E2562_022316 [Oryza meyeriana var. granulata]|uniref:DUF3148 domain-containing protein n=1 Tax=Oryza meyeriana var. granulata TaxID=110450 RepID=A0A6G1D5A4_9ORYZ|nr:hypothetical protein E2562_022316 [Oryza meyeriana var. granulata]